MQEKIREHTLILYIPGARTMPNDSPVRRLSFTVASSKLWFKFSCKLPPECLPESSDNVGEPDLNSERKKHNMQIVILRFNPLLIFCVELNRKATGVFS